MGQPPTQLKECWIPQHKPSQSGHWMLKDPVMVGCGPMSIKSKTSVQHCGIGTFLSQNIYIWRADCKPNRNVRLEPWQDRKGGCCLVHFGEFRSICSQTKFSHFLTLGNEQTPHHSTHQLVLYPPILGLPLCPVSFTGSGAESLISLNLPYWVIIHDIIRIIKVPRVEKWRFNYWEAPGDPAPLGVIGKKFGILLYMMTHLWERWLPSNEL